MSFLRRIYPRKKNNPARSFTLAELLISVTIFAAVSGAVYTTFNCGMNVWRRMQNTDGRIRKQALRIERLSRELRSAINFNEIPFIGLANQITFAAIPDSQISRITYSFDPQQRSLYRSADRFLDILAAKKENTEFKSNHLPYWQGEIQNVKFSYLYFDLSKNAYLWKEEWTDPVLPLAVKVEIITDHDDYTKTIFIPVA
jgi:Tfp pilus assembly protein PilE